MKSVDHCLTIIADLLTDVQTSCKDAYTPRELRLDIQKISRRSSSEGICFFTKQMPRLGKAFDKALLGQTQFTSTGFRKRTDSQIPRILGCLFERVFDRTGMVLQNPCTDCIRHVRQILYLFYKYELPNTSVQEQQVLSQFIQTEQDLLPYHERYTRTADHWESTSGFPDWSGSNPSTSHQHDIRAQTKNEEQEAIEETVRSFRRYCSDILSSTVNTNTYSEFMISQSYSKYVSGVSNIRQPLQSKILLGLKSAYDEVCSHVHKFNTYAFHEDGLSQLPRPSGRDYLGLLPQDHISLIRKARRILERVFSDFDPTNIVPRHGPGAVSTGERLWDKFNWTSVSPRIVKHYPLDAYFYASLGHVCDELDSLSRIKLSESPARVILVPKDSRGPRLISCEPLAMQWIQQGLGRAIMVHVEQHPLTRRYVHFTEQQHNQRAALKGSLDGSMATIDLKEASDRITVGLVRCLWPEPLLERLLAARSTDTQMPDGKLVHLNKFAPMGSALCFPILATTVWALLAAGIEDTQGRESLLVYGDDVIVNTANAEHAISILESVGLMANRDKCCIQGFFKESCGTDAYKGVEVTPVRFRTVWKSRRSPSVYSSWIEYANSMYDRGYHRTYNGIVDKLIKVYKNIPEDSLNLSVPSLRSTLLHPGNFKTRINCNLQKQEYKVLSIVPRLINKEINSWSMLLRYFTEGHRHDCLTLLSRINGEVSDDLHYRRVPHSSYEGENPFCASQYTKRGTVSLVQCWR